MHQGGEKALYWRVLKTHESIKPLSPVALADLSNYQPTQFQPVGLCKKSTGNQPRSYPHIGPPAGDSWISWNQPSFQRCALRYEGWNGFGFCKTNLHSNYSPPAFLYEGWKSVGFGLIFCTKQLSTVGPVREGVNSLFFSEKNVCDFRLFLSFLNLLGFLNEKIDNIFNKYNTHRHPWFS